LLVKVDNNEKHIDSECDSNGIIVVIRIMILTIELTLVAIVITVIRLAMINFLKCRLLKYFPYSFSSKLLALFI